MLLSRPSRSLDRLSVHAFGVLGRDGAPSRATSLGFLPRARSSARLEQGAFNPRVAGSNPAGPTGDRTPCRQVRLGSRDATEHLPGASGQRVDDRRARQSARTRAWPAQTTGSGQLARHVLRAMPVGAHVRHDGADHRGVARCAAPRRLGPHDASEAPADAEAGRAPHPGMPGRRRRATGRSVRAAGAVRAPPGGSTDGAQTIAPMMRRRSAAEPVAVRAMIAATT